MAAPCNWCRCKQWEPNRWRPEICSNCLHKHDSKEQPLPQQLQRLLQHTHTHDEKLKLLARQRHYVAPVDQEQQVPLSPPPAARHAAGHSSGPEGGSTRNTQRTGISNNNNNNSGGSPAPGSSPPSSTPPSLFPLRNDSAWRPSNTHTTTPSSEPASPASLATSPPRTPSARAQVTERPRARSLSSVPTSRRGGPLPSPPTLALFARKPVSPPATPEPEPHSLPSTRSTSTTATNTETLPPNLETQTAPADSTEDEPDRCEPEDTPTAEPEQEQQQQQQDKQSGDTPPTQKSDPPTSATEEAPSEGESQPKAETTGAPQPEPALRPVAAQTEVVPSDIQKAIAEIEEVLHRPARIPSVAPAPNNRDLEKAFLEPSTPADDTPVVATREHTETKEHSVIEHPEADTPALTAMDLNNTLMDLEAAAANLGRHQRGSAAVIPILPVVSDQSPVPTRWPEASRPPFSTEYLVEVWISHTHTHTRVTKVKNTHNSTHHSLVKKKQLGKYHLGNVCHYHPSIPKKKASAAKKTFSQFLGLR